MNYLSIAPTKHPNASRLILASIMAVPGLIYLPLYYIGSTRVYVEDPQRGTFYLMLGLPMLVLLCAAPFIADRLRNDQVYFAEDGDGFLAINCSQSKQVPIKKSDIASVTEKRFARGGKLIYIKLKTETSFGDELKFRPFDFHKKFEKSLVTSQLEAEIVRQT